MAWKKTTKKRMTAKAVPEATKAYVKKTISRKVDNKETVVNAANGPASYDAPIISSLVGPAEGTGQDERIGDKIYLNSLRLKVALLKNASQTVDAVVRLMVLQWNQPDGSAPTLADMFSSASAAYYGEVENNLLLNQGKVLYDKRFVIGATAGDQNTKVASISLFGKKLQRRTIMFDSSVVTKGQLYFIAFSNIANGTNTEPLVNCDGTLSWKDY